MENIPQTQQGNGSQGVDRPGEQVQPAANINAEQEQPMGEDVDEGNHSIDDLGELGMFTGSDDQGSGSDDEIGGPGKGE
ncbi:MAG TPA: hypothetical protein VM935_04250 [Chitinophagaceae bacterium]|jgi:hypothetical protein|nr:hypothetical protein [Chitinophagaceae bacterium]